MGLHGAAAHQDDAGLVDGASRATWASQSGDRGVREQQAGDGGDADAGGLRPVAGAADDRSGRDGRGQVEGRALGEDGQEGVAADDVDGRGGAGRKGAVRVRTGRRPGTGSAATTAASPPA